MLNRYGLFDIDAVLQEQGGDLAQFRGQHGDLIHGLAQDHHQINKVGATGSNAGRFKRMAANDSTVGPALSDKQRDRDDARQTLRSAHERSGMKSPFLNVFDKKTTGLDGQDHIELMSYLGDGRHTPGKNNRGRIELQSPRDAHDMVKAGDLHHDNIRFEVDKNEPNVVNYRPGQRPKPQPTPEMPPAPPAPGGAGGGAMGPMGAPMGTPAPPGPPQPF